MAGITEGEENLRFSRWRGILQPRGHSAMSGHICFWLSKLGRGAIYYYVSWVGAKDTVKHFIMHRAAPPNKELPAPSVNSAKVKKP